MLTNVIANKYDTAVVDVPFDEIQIGNAVPNIRTVFDREKIEELAAVIHRDGLMVPLLVVDTEHAPGRVSTELVAGERRYRAIKHLRKTEPDFMDTVPCVTFEGTLEEARYANASENIDREDVDEVDKARWLFDRTEEGISQAKLAERMSKSPQWVSFRITFHTRACEEVKEAIREGLISFSAAYELSKNLTPEEQAKWVAKSRKLNEKISLSDAQSTNTATKTSTPGKASRSALLKKADKAVDNSGSDVARGIAYALRWVDGHIDDSDIQEIIEFEANK